MRKRIPEPISGGLILSYQCTAECRFCMYACSPRWRDWISEEDLRRILSELSGRIRPSRFGPDGVELNLGLHFTGGEPFLKFDLLLRAVEIAREFEIPSTFVETNCCWCADESETREKLYLLKERGLKGILISVNPFYLEFIPFERTERGIRAALEVFGPRNVMIYQAEYFRRFKKLGIRGKLKLEDYLRLSGEKLGGNVELFLMGRAAYKLRKFYPKYPPESFFDVPCLPPPIRSWHNHFDNYGNFLPGYCGGISLGDARNLSELLREGVDLAEKPVLKFLMQQDLRGLFQFAQERGYKPLQEGYISKCHLCLDIRRYLAKTGEFEELSPREFYEELERDGDEDLGDRDLL